MSKKSWYWIIAILAVLVIGLLIWAAASPKQPPEVSSGQESGMDGQSSAGHGQMDHGQTPASADQALQGYLEEQDAIMAAMMTDMNGIEHSGSAAVDFLAGMIPHHASAVAMAESYLDHGGVQENLAPLARTMIQTQTEEIEQMQSMLELLKNKGNPDMEQEAAYLEAYDRLINGHSMLHSTAESIDAAFAEGMILHHQMAVDMANAILEHTEEEDVKTLAQTMIDTQKQEISEMQSVLDSLQTAADTH